MGWVIYLQVDLKVRRVGHVDDANEIINALARVGRTSNPCACTMAIRDGLPRPDPQDRLRQVDPMLRFKGKKAKKLYHSRVMYAALCGH